jgi:tetratricopeptide (TPR) repeat protein
MKHTSLIATHSLIVFGLSAVLFAAVMPSGNSAYARSIAPNASTAASASSLQVPEAIVRDIKTGYFHRAASSLEPMMPTHAGDPDYQYRYAQTLLGAGRTDEALTAIKSAVALAPKTAVYHRLMGEVYGVLAKNAGIFHALGLARHALAEFRMAVKLDPQDPRSLADLATYYFDAPWIAGGSTEKASRVEALLDKLSPVNALQVRAQEARRAKDYAKAEVLLKQAARLDKTSDSLTTLAFFYLGKGRYADAFPVFQAITTKTPDDAQAWYWIGRTADLTHSHYADGIAALKHYIALPERPDGVPSLAFAHLRLGDLYRLAGRKNMARTEYAEAQKADGANDKQFKSELKKSLNKLR